MQSVHNLLRGQCGGGDANHARDGGGGDIMSPDLTTRYLGLELKNPLVVAACPLTGQ